MTLPDMVPRKRPPPQVGSPEAIGHRLRLVRMAYGRTLGLVRELSQSELSRMLGCGISAWNNAETGDARIGLDNAIKLRRVTGVSLDYIYEGDVKQLPHAIMREIEKILAEEDDDAVRSRA